MEHIAQAAGMGVFAPRKGDYSFCASPYSAHRDYAAVDIYQGTEFGGPALSPVEGTVWLIKEFESPTPTGKPLPEYLTFVKSGDFLARMMHLKPSVKPGDRIAVGDPLGELITNGFFTYWVDPGIHLEIRPMKCLLRAKGGLELAPAMPELSKASTSIQGIASTSNGHNTTVILKNPAVATVGGKPAVLDGTLSLDYSGLFDVFPSGEAVYLSGIPIGKTMRSGRYMTLFSTDGLSFFANNKEIAGASFVSQGRVMKLIPRKYGEILFSAGEKVELRIERK